MTDRRRVLAEALASGEVTRIAVEDPQRGGAASTLWYALASDVPLLTAAARRRSPSRGTTMLAPFDSFLWHRERTARLFGFDYRIEVYTPGPKRIHGYYVMPILHDGQLIGRLDAKVHRQERRLEAKRIGFDRGAPLAGRLRRGRRGDARSRRPTGPGGTTGARPRQGPSDCAGDW
jgi:uncharacterized protein YcaQ